MTHSSSSQLPHEFVDDGASSTVLAGSTRTNQLVQGGSDCLKIRYFLFDKLLFLLREYPGFQAVLANRKRKQQLDVLQRESQALSALDETQTIDRVRSVSPYAAVRSLRYGHQPEPLVIPNGLEMDAGCFRQSTDRDSRFRFPRHEGLDSVVDYGNKLTFVDSVIAKETMASSFQKAVPLAPDSATEGRGSSTESAALAAGGIAALLAGACCVVPFVLVSIGLGGAWLANLQLLQPYRWVFIGVAVIALAFAWKRIYRPAVACEPGAVCSTPRVRRGYKIGFWSVVGFLLLMAGYPYYAPLLY